MKIFVPALAVLALAASAAAAQMPYASPTAQPAGAPPALDVPILGNAQVSADCGNLYQMAGRAYCLTAPLAVIGALADSYSAHFQSEGWLPAAGEDNRVVFIKRREGGGCDGLQVVAFYDTARPAVPEAAGYLGFATIPGDICTSGAPAQ